CAGLPDRFSEGNGACGRCEARTYSHLRTSGRGGERAVPHRGRQRHVPAHACHRTAACTHLGACLAERGHHHLPRQGHLCHGRVPSGKGRYDGDTRQTDLHTE